LALVDHDFHHLFTDDFLLRALGVTGSFDLLSSPFCEGDAENPEHVPVNSLGLNESFHQCVPFLHQGAQFVLCYVHTVEVSVAIVALDFFNLDFHFSPGISTTAFGLQISQRYFEDSAFQTVSCDLLTGSLVARS